MAGISENTPSQQQRSLPLGTRLVHVGPHKTGTTAIQGALHAARARLSDYGVWLPSPARNPVDEVRAAAAYRSAASDGDAPDLVRWRELAGTAARAGDRISVISSEFFADADTEAITRIAGDLGGSGVHVVVTVRPLVKIMPSQWQQNVQTGSATPYADWLESLLADSPKDVSAQSFWHRHRHDEFAARWAGVVGPENLTVVVVDDTDRDRLLRVFEQLLGLPTELLTPAKNAMNRSLTAGEIEVIRRLSEQFAKRGWSKELYQKYVRYGAIPRMKTARNPAPGEPKITTPKWARDQAAAIGADIAEGIDRLGVRVIGDLAVLRDSLPDEAEPGDVMVDPSAAAEALYGVLRVVDTDQKETVQAGRARGKAVREARSSELVRVVAQRAGRRMFGRRRR